MTEKAKMQITQDLYHQAWDTLINSQDPNEKASILQDTVMNIVNKYCPIRSVRTPVGKNPIKHTSDKQVTSGKKAAFKKKSPSWKYLSAKFKSKLEENINSMAAGSKTWWNGTKDVAG